MKKSKNKILDMDNVVFKDNGIGEYFIISYKNKKLKGYPDTNDSFQPYLKTLKFAGIRATLFLLFLLGNKFYSLSEKITKNNKII